MTTSTRTRRIAARASMAILLLCASSASAELLQLFGTVTIDNEFDKPADIYLEKLAPWGKRGWKKIGRVEPMSAGTFVGIREGTMMGAAVVDIGPQPSFKVTFRRVDPHRPMMTHALRPRGVAATR